MIKYSILSMIVGVAFILGLTMPTFEPRRGPVPPSQKVAHSSHCAGCHGFDEAGEALVDGQGKDVNIYDDWQYSMMGLSAHDPFWRATIAHEVNSFPTAKEEIEGTCLKCHAPLGSIQSHLTGLPYSFNHMLGDSLGLDGVSCSSCHQQPAVNLGKGHSGNFTIDTNRVMFGPYPNPFLGPMQIYVGFDPVFSDHMSGSGVCAGCHTLITHTLHEDGTPSGDSFVEQATYHEWLNSSYPSQFKECQSCHMPIIKDSVVIATDFKSLTRRYPFSLHQFFGANTAMLTMMKANRDSLNIFPTSPNRAWDESIQNNRVSIGRAATLDVFDLQIADDTLSFRLSVKNKTGHKFPSGYPSRLAWIKVILTDATGSDTIYTNGILDEQGHIEGRDFPYEPHHETIRSSDEVQIYEMAMADLHGDLTTRLNAAYQPLKDNRLLPLGFRRTHAVYDTVAVWGEANADTDYGTTSTAGADNIIYKLSLNGNKGLADLDISFLYHSLPARWMNDLFTHDSLAYVAKFKSMYEGYSTFTEIVDTIHIHDIDLSTSSLDKITFGIQVKLFPNPVMNDWIMITLPDGLTDIENLHYTLISTDAIVIQKDEFSHRIELSEQITSGVYYYVLYRKNEMLSITPFYKM